MSSAQSALISLLQYDYTALVVLTAVGYDYALTFPNEVEYVWCKPWSCVSMLFILVRYLGLLNVITCSLLGSSFLPGPTKMYVFVFPSLSGLPNTADIHQIVVRTHAQGLPVHSIDGYFQGEIIYTIDTWAFYLFLGAADAVMILRVWAMYNRSRPMLCALLMLFSVEIISSILGAAINSIPKNISAPIVQIGEFSFCSVTPTPVWTDQAAVSQITHGAVLCVLAIIQFVRQSLQMYRATKRWQLNRYMNLFLKQGILYFFAIFLFNLMSILGAWGKFPMGGWQLTLSLILDYVPVFTLTPRFILRIRELYTHDVEGRRGEGIDTGFGLSLSDANAGGTVVFADVERDGGLESIDEFGTTRAV